MKKLKNINYGKILAVIFLTALIWIWADLMLEENLEISSSLAVAKSIEADVFVTLGQNDQISVPIEEIVLKGPASKISTVRQQLNEGTLDFGRFFFNPTDEGMTGEGPEILDVRQFLRGKDEIAQLGLTVESTKPEKVQVRIIKLIQQQVKVEAIDENGNIIERANIEPDQISMFVPDYGTRLPPSAKVMLTPAQIADARLNPPVMKKPYILLFGHQKKADTDVAVTLTNEETRLQEHIISRPTLGYVFTDSMAGEYDVKCENETEMTTVSIQATPEAAKAYENQPYKILLYILDEDKRKEGSISRQVVYNFPKEYVEKGEIRLSANQAPVIADFKLIALPAGAGSAPVGTLP